MKNIIGSCCLILGFLCVAASVQAQESWTDQLSNAVTQGKVSLDFRYRFEHVDQESFSKNAKASTLRSRITLASAPLSGFSALLEFDDVSTLGATCQIVNLTVGYEVLGGGDGVGFQTPLATLHGLQGWADKFLITPDDGVEDFYLGIDGKVGPVKLTAVYHDFQAENSRENYGTEWDLAVSWPLNKYVTVSGHYAVFSTDSERYDDTDKVWFTAQLVF